MHPMLTIFGGIIGLAIGAIVIVNAAKNIAKKYGISQSLIGLTIIIIGTSLPEIFINFEGALLQLNTGVGSGLAVGVVIGSCIAQMALIIGITGLLSRVDVSRDDIKTYTSMLLGSIILVFLTAYFIGNSIITRGEGILLMLIYLAFLYFMAKKAGVYERLKQDSYLCYSHRCNTIIK
jgi:cation:H+ antiporter